MRAKLAGLTAAAALLVGSATARAEQVVCPEPHDHFDLSFGIDLFSVERDACERRVDVLDLLLVRGFRMRSTADSEHIEVLDAPLVTLFESRTDGAERSVRVVDLPLVELFSHDSDADSSDTEVLDLPLLGSLYRHRVDERGTRIDLLYLIRVHRSAEPPAPDGFAPR